MTLMDEFEWPEADPEIEAIVGPYASIARVDWREVGQEFKNAITRGDSRARRSTTPE